MKKEGFIEISKCLNCNNFTPPNYCKKNPSNKDINEQSSCSLFDYCGEIKTNKYDYKLNKLKEKVDILLFDKKLSEATEEIANFIKKENHVYTTRHDNKSDMWIYKEGIYKSEGKTYIKEICRSIFNLNYTLKKSRTCY